MEVQQNATSENKNTTATQIEPDDESHLSTIKQQWIDFTATQGLITDADGITKKITVQQFAEMVGVNRATLFRWRTSIPNFWEKVAERVRVFYDGNRTIKVINSIYINATVKLNPKAQEMWMANQKLIEFRTPSQKIEHEFTGGMADLLDRARSISQQSQDHNQVIEGEVINDSQAINS